MRKTWTITRLSFLRWQSSPRVLAGFLLGLVFSLRLCQRYLALVNALGNSGNIFEPAVIQGNVHRYYVFLLLGLLMILGDAPFIKPGTTLVLIRVERKAWIRAQMRYIFLTSILYHAFSFAVTALAVFFSAATRAGWSEAVRLMTAGGVHFIAAQYQLEFGFPAMVEALQPWEACLITLLFNSLYGSLLCCCLFALNLIGGGYWGWGAAAALHIGGYLVLMNPDMQGWAVFSPLSHAFAGLHFTGQRFTTLSASLLMFILLHCVLLWFARYASGRYEVKTKA